MGRSFFFLLFFLAGSVSSAVPCQSRNGDLRVRIARVIASQKPDALAQLFVVVERLDCFREES